MNPESSEVKYIHKLEKENNLLKKSLKEKEEQVTSLQTSLKNSNMRVSKLGERIVDAGRLLNNKKVEFDKLNTDYGNLQKEYQSMMEQKENEIEELKNSISSLNVTIETKNKELKELNERYEVILKNSLEETTLCSQLQDQVSLLEKQLKEIQIKEKRASGDLEKPIVINSPSLYQLLRETQQRLEKVQTEFADLEKNYSLVCNEKKVLKEDYDELHGLYEEIAHREMHLQGLNRQLRNKLVTAESRLVEVTGNSMESQPSSTHSSTSETINVTENTSNLSRKESLIIQENQELVDLLHILSGMTSIPYVGVGNVLQYLESERNRLISCYRDERCKRRNLDEKIVLLRNSYEQLQLVYERFSNPVEGFECCYAMKQEKDISVIQEALEEKCSHLHTLRNQITQLEKEKGQLTQTIQQLYSINSMYEEGMRREQDAKQYKELQVNELKVEVEKLKKEVEEERKLNNEMKKDSEEMDKLNKKIEELNEEIEKKEKVIVDLHTQLVNTEVMNEIWDSALFKDSLFLPEKKEEDTDLLKNQIKMEKEHAKQLEKSIHQLGDQIVVFFFTFCDVCIDYKINLELADSISKRVTHLNKSTENLHYCDDIIQIINEGITLVDTSLGNYINSYVTKYRQLFEENKNAQDEIHKNYQEQIELYKARLRLYEDNTTTLTSTVVSIPSADATHNETTMNYTFLQKQYDNLQSANQVYLKQIDELSNCLQSALERSPLATVTSTIYSNDYDTTMIRYQLDQEKASKTLWKTRAEQLEVLFSQSTNNQSCITDYELSILATVINYLFDFVEKNLHIDFDLNISVDFCEKQYNMQVREQENREPLLMETKLYVIHRIIDAAITAFESRLYQKELECEANQEKIYFLEKKLYS